MSNGAFGREVDMSIHCPLLCRLTRVGLVFALSLTAWSALAQQGRRINGKDNPELIPIEVVWELFFQHVVGNVFVDSQGQRHAEPIPDLLDGYASQTLLIPTADAAVVATVARDALERMTVIRQPLTDEHEGKVHLSWTLEQRKAEVARSFGE